MYQDDGNLRRYGLTNGGEPDGAPTWEPAASSLPPCPNCGANTCEVKVSMKAVPLLRGGVGIAHYFGCPACPWASPAMTTATTPKETN